MEFLTIPSLLSEKEKQGGDGTMVERNKIFQKEGLRIPLIVRWETSAIHRNHNAWKDNYYNTKKYSKWKTEGVLQPKSWIHYFYAESAERAGDSASLGRRANQDGRMGIAH